MNDLLCYQCMLDVKVRRAWTVRAGNAACIFHAVDGAWGEGYDMEEHSVFVEVYERLREMGHPDAH